MKDKGKKGLNDKGIALVTALILSLLALVIATATIYMLLQGTEVSGLKKRYTSALGASKGATEATALIISLSGSIPSDLAGITTVSNPSCFDKKLTNRKVDWGVCDTGETISSSSYDIKFDLTAYGGYEAYAKIVDTVPGNTLIGESLEVKGVVSGQSGYIKNPTVVPYMYRLEVMGENPDNRETDSAEITALYAN